MSKVSGVYLAIVVTASASLPTIAMAENLSISVVDDSKHGVSSVIYQGVAADVIIGTTKNDGTLLVPSYNCNYDKPLQAKPIDASYFNSNQEPCKTTLSFLVHSRMTPSGNIAFNRISTDVKFPDGSDGQIYFKIAMNIDKYTVKVPQTANRPTVPGLPGGSDACKLDYNIKGYGSVSKLAADGWRNVTQSREPATNILSFDEKSVNQLFTGYAAIKNDAGITVFVPGDCANVSTLTIDEFAGLIKGAADRKVKAGQYKNPKDLIQFNELK